jgi:hypothetical protein
MIAYVGTVATLQDYGAERADAASMRLIGEMLRGESRALDGELHRHAETTRRCRRIE